MNEQLNYFNNIKDSCMYKHNAYLFLESCSNKFEYGKMYYKCICLDCNKIGYFDNSIYNMNKTIFTGLTEEQNLKIYNIIKEKYIYLKQKNIDIKKIIKILNNDYDENKFHTKKINNIKGAVFINFVKNYL